jgi:predicted small secreted protein
MKRLCILLASLTLASCATTGEYHRVGKDDWLESEARRNDAIAEVMERNGSSSQSTEVFRSKARELPAERKSSPTLSETTAGFGVDVFFSALLNALDPSSRTKPAR